jgi:hypothetical protein
LYVLVGGICGGELLTGTTAMLLALARPGGVPCNDASLVGGYKNATGSELHTGLEYGLDFVDYELGQMLMGLQHAGLDNDTLVIIEAKHGQSPINGQLRVAVDDSPYNDTPGLKNSNGSKTTDDVALVWLSPQMQQGSYKAAEAYLLSQKSTDPGLASRRVEIMIGGG